MARREMKNCMSLRREAHFEVKKLKAKSTSRSDHCWKLRCRKNAHGCGAKHIWKSTCTKHTRAGALLEVEMSKKFISESKVQKQTGSEHFWKLSC